jgi:glucosylceramidase
MNSVTTLMTSRNTEGPYPGDWGRAETYAHDILGDLLNYAEGWTDWNAFLDEKGGLVNAFC